VNSSWKGSFCCILKSVALLLLLPARVPGRHQKTRTSGRFRKCRETVKFMGLCCSCCCSNVPWRNVSLSPSSFLYRSSSSPLHPRPFEIHVHTG
jgi:hypothetical protein